MGKLYDEIAKEEKSDEYAPDIIEVHKLYEIIDAMKKDYVGHLEKEDGLRCIPDWFEKWLSDDPHAEWVLNKS